MDLQAIQEIVPVLRENLAKELRDLQEKQQETAQELSYSEQIQRKDRKLKRRLRRYTRRERDVKHRLTMTREALDTKVKFLLRQAMRLDQFINDLQREIGKHEKEIREHEEEQKTLLHHLLQAVQDEIHHVETFVGNLHRTEFALQTLKEMLELEDKRSIDYHRLRFHQQSLFYKLGRILHSREVLEHLEHKKMAQAKEVLEPALEREEGKAEEAAIKKEERELAA